jgi:CRP/FNR family transcriptional regulator
MIAALLRHFDAELARQLADVAQPVRIPADTMLFSHGSPCRQFLLLLDGVVRVQAFSTGGREIVLYRLHPGEACIMTSACLLGGQAYAAEGIAETALHAATISHRNFERLLLESTAFRGFVFGAFGARITALVGRVEEVALERIDGRLARLLLRLASEVGATIECTHHSLAADLGSAREVVSRQLKAFERCGWVVLRRGRIRVLDHAALEAASSASRR